MKHVNMPLSAANISIFVMVLRAVYTLQKSLLASLPNIGTTGKAGTFRRSMPPMT